MSHVQIHNDKYMPDERGGSQRNNAYLPAKHYAYMDHREQYIIKNSSTHSTETVICSRNYFLP